MWCLMPKVSPSPSCDSSQKANELDRAIHRARPQVHIPYKYAEKEGRQANEESGQTPGLDDAFHAPRRSCPIEQGTSSIDGAFHVPQRSRSSPSSRLSPDIDRAFHVVPQRTPRSHSAKSIPARHGRDSDLSHFERRYRAFVTSVDDRASLVDDLYHDQVIHMMDGVPMDKAALKRLHAFIDALDQGAERTVDKFEAVDPTHVESIVRTRTSAFDFYMRSTITLKDGKIVRVEKLENAAAPFTTANVKNAMAA
ncbi:hypothetical protein ACHAWF_010410 [Thalassiosira exigua]